MFIFRLILSTDSYFTRGGVTNMQEEKGITSRRDTPEALRERSYLAELNKKPLLQRWRGYLKLSGPGQWKQLQH